MRIQKLAALLTAFVLLSTVSAKEGKKEAKKELSNTRIASCLVKVACDPAVLPLSFETIDQLLNSSGVGGKAAREILEILEITVLTDEAEEMVQFGIELISEEPSSGAGRPYGVAPDEEDEQEKYFREMKVVPKMRAFGREIPAMPIPGAPTYTSQHTLFFRLGVQLNKEVKPAAEEFMKALLDNLRKTLDTAFNDYSDRFRQQLEFAQRDAEGAEFELRSLQGSLRSILGSYNLERQAILDDMSRSREKWRDTKMELETNEAFIQETSKRIAETEAKMNEKIANDPILAELQKIIKIHEERITKLSNKGYPEPETSDARENLLRARIELAEHREEIRQSAGAELIDSLCNQISELTVQKAQAIMRMENFQKQLSEAESLLERADEYELISLKLEIAKQTLEESLLLHSRMKRRGLLIQPSVVVFGAE